MSSAELLLIQTLHVIVFILKIDVFASRHTIEFVCATKETLRK